MSPASQGGLEVERYIGSCLFSSRGKPGYGPRYGPGWAGLPLIAVGSPAARRPRPPPRTPLSRLAVHTQGAPLIRCKGPPARALKPVPSPAPPSSDTLSVASDESSGHSENSLPRIIKPRKRRKKDRKPPASVSTPVPVEVPGKSALSKNGETPGIATLDPYAPLCSDTWEPPPREEDPPPSSCQCRLCDPAGLIWDVGQHRYSPVLTPPADPAPFRGPDLYRGLAWATPPLGDPAPVRRPASDSRRSLEVSTEIVTSPNGHRDIEIRFYSSRGADDRPEPEDSAQSEGGGGAWGDVEERTKDLGREVNQLRLRAEE